MEHSFDVKIAKLYGMASAVIFKHIYFWVTQNRENGRNFYDGRYWTYNSQREFQEMYDYMGRSRLSNAFKKLEDEGLIMTGDFNEDRRVRTKWYTVTEKGFSLMENADNKDTVSGGEASENSNSRKPANAIAENMQMQLQETDKCNDGKTGNVYIYNNNIHNLTDTNSNSNTDNITAPSKSEQYADVLPFFLKGGVEWRCPQDFYDEMVLCHPSVDIEEEFMNMRAWTVANPKQRKTKEGAKKFVRNWLFKAKNNYKYKKPRDSNFDSFLDDIERGD